MRNRAYLLVALLGILTFALAPGIAAAAGQGQNLTEIALASDAAARATAVSGPVINATPLSFDFGVVALGSSAMTTFTVTNSGDTDLHIASVIMPSTSFTYLLGTTTVPPSGATSLVVTYAPTTGINESGVITINSDDSHGPFTLNVAGQANAPPTLTLTPAGPAFNAVAFQPFSFQATSTDNADQLDELLTFSLSPLPAGATFNTGSGLFSWTPTLGDVGTYNITVCADDQFGLSDCQNITITVAVGNAPPVAVAGGPYSGAAGQPVSFDGSASSDPDGDPLTFAWTFGDGQTGTGATPSHTYAVANIYGAALTVSDGSLSSTDIAVVTILNSIPANISAKLSGGKMRAKGGGGQIMGMEITDPVTNIDPTTVKLRTTYPNAGSVSVISADPKSATIGDIDKDGVAELDMTFARADISALLGNVPNGTVVTLQMEALTTPSAGVIPVIGTIDVKIQNSGAGGPVSAFASPNPFNPETAVSFTVQNSGRVSVRIYSIEGRLVKTLKDEFTSAGTHEVRWNGMDNSGRQVPSGIYFVKTESAGGSAVFKLSLLK